MPSRTSFPGVSPIQSGCLKTRCGLHQTIGSDACIRYRTRVPSQVWSAGGTDVLASAVNRTVRPAL